MTSGKLEMRSGEDNASVLVLDDVVRPGKFLRLPEDNVVSTPSRGVAASGMSTEDDITTSIRRMVKDDLASETRQAGMDVSSGVRTIIKDELSGWISANVPRLIREVLEDEGLELRQQSDAAPKPKRAVKQRSGAEVSKPKRKSSKSPKTSASAKTASRNVRGKSSRKEGSSAPKRVAKKGRPAREKNPSL
jgi:hypothetical protein